LRPLLHCFFTLGSVTFLQFAFCDFCWGEWNRQKKTLRNEKNFENHWISSHQSVGRWLIFCWYIIGTTHSWNTCDAPHNRLVIIYPVNFRYITIWVCISSRRHHTLFLTHLILQISIQSCTSARFKRISTGVHAWTWYTYSAYGEERFYKDID